VWTNTINYKNEPILPMAKLIYVPQFVMVAPKNVLNVNQTLEAFF